MQKTNRTRRLVRCALLAAVYTVLCLVLGYASFGPVQFRIAEALVMLPVFGPEYIVSSVLGCFLANLLGSTPIDVIFGTAATLVAGQCGDRGRAGTDLLRAGCRRHPARRRLQRPDRGPGRDHLLQRPGRGPGKTDRNQPRAAGIFPLTLCQEKEAPCDRVCDLGLERYPAG